MIYRDTLRMMIWVMIRTCMKIYIYVDTAFLMSK